MNILDLIVIGVSFIGLIYYVYKGDMDCANFCLLMIAIACIADIKKKVDNLKNNTFLTNVNIKNK